MYAVLKDEDQKDISNIYNLSVDTLETYLPFLSNYRNLCAHEDIVYENRTQKVIKNTIYHKMLDIPKENDEYIYGKNDVFALMIMMKQLLDYDKFKSMTIEIENALNTLDYNLKTIKIDDVLNRMGFPNNWKELANIERSVVVDEK